MLFRALHHSRLASLLIRPRKKTGLLFRVPGGGRGWILTRFGPFHPFFPYRFLQTLSRTLIHEVIIAYKKWMPNPPTA